MMHPVGSRPPSVYWRRRLLLFIASLILVVVLVVLAANALTSNGSGATTAAGSAASRTSSTRAHSPSAAPKTSTRHSSATRSSASSPPPPRPSPTPPPTCTVSALRLRAVAQHAGYQVGAQPVLQLQVTNPTGKPCVQDLADRQVELRVYNGESRVWGSHDCKTLPGTTMRTLAPNVAVLVAITWSARTSRPGCAGARQLVSVGTYTLFASLAGRTAQAARFTIS